MEDWREETHHNELYHYGRLERSGRYRWGSGDRPYQRLGGRKQRRALKKANTVQRELTPEELTARKTAVVKSRSALALYNNKELFTDQELQQAVNRLNTEAKLRQLSRAEVDAGRKWLKRIDATQKALDKSVSYYETYKKVSKMLDEISGSEKPKVRKQ